VVISDWRTIHLKNLGVFFKTHHHFDRRGDLRAEETVLLHIPFILRMAYDDLVAPISTPSVCDQSGKNPLKYYATAGD